MRIHATALTEPPPLGAENARALSFPARAPGLAFFSKQTLAFGTFFCRKIFSCFLLNMPKQLLLRKNKKLFFTCSFQNVQSNFPVNFHIQMARVIYSTNTCCLLHARLCSYLGTAINKIDKVFSKILNSSGRIQNITK